MVLASISSRLLSTPTTLMTPLLAIVAPFANSDMVPPPETEIVPELVTLNPDTPPPAPPLNAMFPSLTIVLRNRPAVN